MEDTKEPFDLAVVGGGPAGTACALEACRRGLRVALWERGRFPHPKVCGGFLSAESLEWLRALVPETLKRAAPITRGEFVSTSGRRSSFPLPRTARGLSRPVLDEALWRAAAAAGAQAREGQAVRGLRRLPEGEGAVWKIESAEGRRWFSRAVVIACGRWWALEGFRSPARSEGKRASPWMGAQAHFRGIERSDAVEMYFFPGGYCGLAPLEEGMTNVCCLIHRRRLNGASPRDFAAWLKRVAQHRALEARLRGAKQISETATTAPVMPGRRAATDCGAMLAGDASGFLDPFTGDGISIALASGRLAAQALEQCREEGKDFSHAARIFERRLRRAVGRSYRLAGMLRLLVNAPAGVQEWAAGVLPWMGSRLAAETRWREDRRADREHAAPQKRFPQPEERA